MTYFILLSVFSLLSAYLVTPLVILFAKKYNLLDDTRNRKHPANTHSGIIPRAGGLGIYVAILITSLLFLELNKLLVGVLVGGALIVIMGLLDDYFDVPPIPRLLFNIVIVLITILFGLGVPYISNPFGGVIHLDTVKITVNFFGERSFLLWANLFSLVWITAIMNFINWSSGVDGQLSGFTGVSCIVLGLLALRFSGHEISSESVALMAFITGTAFLGFLPWNFYPQKIMPGYSGGALAGYMLGVLSILSWAKIGTLALVLAIPLLDALYVLIRRIYTKKSPFKGDSGHFHHRLLQIGWGRRRIAVFYLLVSLLMGFAALQFESGEKVLALFITAVFLALFIVVIGRVRDQK